MLAAAAAAFDALFTVALTIARCNRILSSSCPSADAQPLIEVLPTERNFAQNTFVQ